ncbi:putative uncharacterized protein DDB_G0277255 isoform X2 [Condylostylus longicornis]|nr:putative uncharacterized protein DDB_G0277255 isoform X2 [Condylostylus longicornis]
MGRRKWKLFQEIFSRSQTNINIDYYNSGYEYLENLEKSIDEIHLSEKKDYTIRKKIKDNLENDIQVKTENKFTENPNSVNKTIKKEIKNFNTTSSSTSLLDLLEKPSTPIDWKPSDKCYFCIDGKLLTVNEKGELVAESGSALPETELANRSTVDTDSGDSRNSTPDILRSQSLVNVKKKLKTSQQQQQHQQQQQQNQQQLRDSQHPPKMTSLESMAARLAAVASIHPGLQPGLGQLSQLSQLGQIYPNLYYQQLAQILPTTPTPETPLAAISPSNKDSPSPHEACGSGEQPLDLSSKPSLNSPTLTSGDSKQASARHKPRINPVVANRRTYTEEELQNALQDIMSGKLGTRRAAVVYGIPRSTLRNKVYKIASEQRRETSTPSSMHIFDADDDDNENDDTDKIGLSDDEVSGDKLLESSLLSDQEHPSRYDHTALQKCRKINNSSGGASSSDEQIKPSTPLDTVVTATTTVKPTSTAAAAQNKNISSQPSQTPPIGTNWLDPSLLLQTLLLSGSLTGNSNASAALAHLASLFNPASNDPTAIRDLLNVLKLQQEELLKKLSNQSNDANNRESLNNEKSLIDQTQLLQDVKHQQQLEQMHHQHHHPARLPKSDTPETGSSIDINETNEDGVILKIPSFKPVVVPASSSSTASSMKSCDQNQISPSSASTHHIPPILSRSPHQPNSLPGISPPLLRQNSESQSPPGVSMREIIANSLNRFNQQSIKDNSLGKASHYNDLNEQFGKRASISVIKNIGGTDITKFAATPNLLNNYQNAANQCAAGKGTRPKRGKYRNYDRDSLTEAVKAVQRGEMSVHRAGSYYGVPHSTLEYKVKERHLMRPRKREPKPQPLDGSSSSNTSSTVNSKHSNIPGLAAVNNIDKLKTSVGHQQQKTALKPNQTSPFPNTSPNGMKVSIFDPGLTAQLQYAAPHLFWQHSAAAAASFNPLPMEFSPTSRTASTGPGNGSSGNSTATSPGLQPNPFSPNTDSFLATQMIQRFHEESRLNTVTSNSSKSPSLSGNNPTLNSSNSNNLNNNNSSNVPLKTAREIAQSLYDSGNANGSFLDGIIRQTLDRKSNNDIPHGALFDQLIKNTKPPLLSTSNTLGGSTPSSSSSSSEIHSHALVNALTSNKRSASPNSYPVINIKRERSISPTLQSSSTALLGNSIIIDRDLHHHSKRNSINDDNDSSSDVKIIKESSSPADSLIKARLEGIMIKTETNEHQNVHHITDSTISQRHHTNTSTSSLDQDNRNSTGSINISHSVALEDLNGNNIESGTGSSNIRTDNSEIVNKDSRSIIPSDDLILKSKLGLIKSETDENL